eukprot:7376468-Prymnesium_polylepis.1
MQTRLESDWSRLWTAPRGCRPWHTALASRTQTHAAVLSRAYVHVVSGTDKLRRRAGHGAVLELHDTAAAVARLGVEEATSNLRGAESCTMHDSSTPLALHAITAVTHAGSRRLASLAHFLSGCHRRRAIHTAVLKPQEDAVGSPPVPAGPLGADVDCAAAHLHSHRHTQGSDWAQSASADAHNN